MSGYGEALAGNFLVEQGLGVTVGFFTQLNAFEAVPGEPTQGGFAGQPRPDRVLRQGGEVVVIEVNTQFGCVLCFVEQGTAFSGWIRLVVGPRACARAAPGQKYSQDQAGTLRVMR